MGLYIAYTQIYIVGFIGCHSPSIYIYIYIYSKHQNILQIYKIKRICRLTYTILNSLYNIIFILKLY